MYKKLKDNFKEKGRVVLLGISMLELVILDLDDVVKNLT